GERHVDWARHDVDSVGAHVGSQFDLTHDNGFFGEHTQSCTFSLGLRNRAGHLDTADTRLARRFSALFENVFEHVADFARVGAVELDKLADHFRGRHVYLTNHAGKLPDNVSVLRHQKSGCFRQGENVDRPRASLKICHQHLLELLWVRVLQVEQEADHRVSRRNIRQIGNNWDWRFPRILTRPDYINDVLAGRNERDPIQTHAHLNDLDGFLARHIFGDENVHLPLHEVIHHQFLSGELFIKVQNVDDVAVWKLKPNRCRRAWRDRCWRGVGGLNNVLRRLRLVGRLSSGRGKPRIGLLSADPRYAGQREHHDKEKPVHGLI